MKHAIRSGEIRLGNLTIKVHVLNDGQRIIEQQSLFDFMKYMEEGKLTSENAEKFAKELKSF